MDTLTVKILAEMVKRVSSEKGDLETKYVHLLRWANEAYRAIELANAMMSPVDLNEWQKAVRDEGIMPALLTRAPEGVSEYHIEVTEDDTDAS